MLVPKKFDKTILPFDDKTCLPDKYISEIKTYPDYLRFCLAFIHVRLVAGIDKQINPSNVSFILKDNGVHAFILVKFLENLFLDQFLSSVALEDFYESTPVDDELELSVSVDFNVNGYLKSLDDTKSFLMGTLSEDRNLEILELFSCDEIANLTSDIRRKTSILIEQTIYSLIKFKKLDIPNVSKSSHITSDYYLKLKDHLDCAKISRFMLPNLTFTHGLECKSCFANHFSVEAIDSYKNNLNISILFNFIQTFSVVFKGIYSTFADHESQQIINKEYASFSKFLFDLFEYNVSNKIPTMKYYFNHLDSIEKKKRRLEARNLQKLNAEKKIKEVREEKTPKSDSLELDKLEKERIAQLEIQARLEESKALLEEQKVKDEQYQDEQFHRKINYILTRKSEILLELQNLIQQLEASEYGSSAQSVRWRRELQKSLIALSDEFNFLSNLDEVRVSESLEISLDFSVEEFDEYSIAVNDDFQTLISSLTVKNT